MACGGYYTGLMLTMAQTALGNATYGTGDSNSLFDHVSGSIGDFIDSTPILKDLSDMAQSVSSNIADWGEDVFSNFSSMGDGVFNGLGLSLSQEGRGVLGDNFMTLAIGDISEEILGVDISVYLSHVAQANSWTAGRNAIITSAIIDTAEYAVQYNNSIDGLVTGKLSEVNKALPTFSSEMANTGAILDFENLNQMGNPLNLLKNLQIQSGGLAVVETALLQQGINPTTLNTVLADTKDLNGIANLSVFDVLGAKGVVAIPESTLVSDASGGTTVYADTSSPLANKGLGAAVYDALGTITGTDLSTFQSVMGSNVQGVTSAQDLLDPSKLFPESYESLTSQAPLAKVENNQTEQAQQLLTGSAKIYTG